jgi:hypothetical protein
MLLKQLKKFIHYINLNKMQQELFQLYDTDIWGSHASRTNLGVFSSVHEALYSLVRNPQTDEADLDRLKAIFKNDNRLFVEKITLNEVEGYSQVFDSENDDCLDELKKIIFFESIEKHKNDLGFLAVDDEEIPLIFMQSKVLTMLLTT